LVRDITTRLGATPPQNIRERGELPIFAEALTKKRGPAEKAAPRFATLALSLKFRQYILGNKKPRDRHRLKVGRGFLRGLHKDNNFYGGGMQATFSDQLRRAISHERLDAYRQRGTSNDDVELFAHYAWNMALSESLYTPLQCLEVSLRNSIHDAASAHFKTDTWFDLPGVLSPQEINKV
jgi:hypothetical protein